MIPDDRENENRLFSVIKNVEEGEALDFSNVPFELEPIVLDSVLSYETEDGQQVSLVAPVETRLIDEENERLLQSCGEVLHTFVISEYESKEMRSSQIAYFAQNAFFVEFTRKTPKMDQAQIENKVFATGITVEKIIVGQEDKIKFIKLRVSDKDMDISKSFTVPVSALTGGQAGREQLKPMIDMGYDFFKALPGVKDKHTLAGLIGLLVSKNHLQPAEKRIPTEIKPMSPGWHQSEDLLKLDTHILHGFDESIINKYNRYPFHLEGDRKAYFDIIKKLLSEHTGLILPLSAAVSGFLCGSIARNANSFIYHFYDRGGSSAGKTVGMQVAASLIGSPIMGEPMLQQWSASPSSMRGILYSLNNAFICFDEFNMADKAKRHEILMMIANGQAPSRSTHTGGLRDTASWLMSVLSTANESIDYLVNSDNQVAALNVRTIEFDIEKTPFFNPNKVDGSEIKDILADLLDNHGWAYEPIINNITQNKAKYADLIKTLERGLIDYCNQKIENERLRRQVPRKLDGIINMFVATEILQAVLEMDLTAHKELIWGEVESIISQASAVHKAEAEISFAHDLTQFVNHHANYFIDSVGATNSAKVTGHKIGKITKTEYWITASKLTNFFADDHAVFEKIKEFAEKAKANGALVLAKDGKVTMNKGGALGRCYVFSREKIQEFLNKESNDGNYVRDELPVAETTAKPYVEPMDEFDPNPLDYPIKTVPENAEDWLDEIDDSVKH